MQRSGVVQRSAGRGSVSVAVLALAFGAGLSMAQNGEPAAAAPGPGPGSVASATLPTPQEVFDRHIQAAGGLEKLKAVRNRRIRGTFEGAPFKAAVSMNMWQDAPNKWHARLSEPAGLRVDIAYDGEDAWQAVSGQAPFWLVGLAKTEIADNAAFYGDVVGYEERYSSLGPVQRIDLSGRSVYAVNATLQSQRELVLMFDAATGLQVGLRAALIAGDRIRVADIIYGDYRDIDGVKVITGVTQRFVGDPEQAVWTFKDITLNADDEHSYAPPAGMPPKPAPKPADAKGAASPASE